MKRTEAITFLKEISRRCGDHLILDSVSLTPNKEHQDSSEKLEPHYKILLQTSIDLISECDIKSLLKEKGLKMDRLKDLFIIYRS